MLIRGNKTGSDYFVWYSRGIITKVDYAYEADAYFPNLDLDPDWEVTADSDEQTYFDIAYTFVRYERKK